MFQCEIDIEKKDLPVLTLSFSADSTKLYFGNNTSIINIFDLGDEIIQSKPIRIEAPSSPLREIVVSENGKNLVSMGLEHSYLYDVEQKRYVAF